MQCFFDGSSTEAPSGGHIWLTLAGFVAPDCFWSDFNRAWTTEVLQKRALAPYLHMRDLVGGNGPYDGWARERRNALVTDANLYLQSLPKRSFAVVVCSVDVTARDKIAREGNDIPEAACLCGNCCIGIAFDWFDETYPENLELAQIFFDRGERFMDPFRQRWLKESKNQKVVVTKLFWGRISEVEAFNSIQTPGLQAADFIAWGQSRRRSSAEDRPMRYLATIQELIVPSWSIILDEKLLREKHSSKIAET